MSNHDKIVDNITQVIGNTPLIRLQKITGECKASVVAKVENMNPLWSVKDRIGKAMIDAAERDGKFSLTHPSLNQQSATRVLHLLLPVLPEVTSSW